MRLATPVKPSSVKTEQIILFRVSGQLFAVSSASIQEVRGVDSLSGAATEISAPGLRKVRQLLIDGIEKMTTMTRLQALPLSFCHEERRWYRGLTALDQTVVPVVHPEGFLSPEELALLDAALLQADQSAGEAHEGTNSAE